MRSVIFRLIFAAALMRAAMCEGTPAAAEGPRPVVPRALPLADALSHLQPGEIENWLLRVGGVLSLALLALLTRKAWLDNFGRKPPLDDEMRALQQALAGYAPKEVIATIVAQLEKAATKEELAKVLSLLNDKELDLARQIKDVRSYAHDAVHETRNDLGARLTSLEGDGRHDAEEMWKVINGVRLAASQIQSDVAAVKALRESNGERLSEISRKTDEIATKVDRLGGIVDAKLKVGGGA